MPEQDHGGSFGDSLRYLQENIRRSGPAAAAGYTLIAAIVLLGGLGYAADQWLETSPWLLLAGLLIGIVVGFYELAKMVWRQ
jgi:F0F1-type ATP synthase assembly protein I